MVKVKILEVIDGVESVDSIRAFKNQVEACKFVNQVNVSINTLRNLNNFMYAVVLDRTQEEPKDDDV